ncbi:MAG: hypothetical protein U0031_15045 [Thermomicrobiales bacterium]
MMRWFVALVAALILMTPLVPGTTAQDTATLKIANDPKLGAFLTDAAGKTLYLFTKDTEQGKSVCSDDCAAAWPPLAASDGMTLPEGVPGTLGSIDRADGTKQATYNDIPLYYFAKDDEAGDVYGEGVGGVWFVVAPGAALGPYAAAPGEGTPTPASTLRVGFTDKLGPFLTDADGRTVYLFTKDTEKGKSACSDDCAAAWPPVPAADAMLLPAGVPGALTAIDRADGGKQLAYNDIPLYYYAKDDEPGDTYGQEVGDVWYIVTPGMHFGDEPHESEE